MNDALLFNEFVVRGDERAFREIVERHGPRVIRICRRVLSRPEDVEDAYQRTFLILIQKAPTLRDATALGNWLHGVAHRVSIRLGRDLARRRRLENEHDGSRSLGDDPSQPWDDSTQTLHEELATLPDAYRIPLELCYLRGQSHEQAASQLGWPLGTLKTRVLRGRQRLFDRLTRRGVTIGAWLLWWLWPRSAAEASASEPQGTLREGSPGSQARDRSTPGTVSPGPAGSKFAALSALASIKPLWIILFGLVTTLVFTQFLGEPAPAITLCE